MKMVRVDWLDSTSIPRWRDGKELRRIVKRSAPTGDPCVSIGFLFKKDRRKLVLIQSWNSTGSVTEALVIPRSVVRKLKVLR